MKPIIGITVTCSTGADLVINNGVIGPDKVIQHISSDYVKAIERAGGTPVLLPITENLDSLDAILEKLDGVLFIGGSDIDPCFYGAEHSEQLGKVNSIRDNHELELAKKVLYETNLPILGICRGCQLLNVVSGGTLYQDLPTERPLSEIHTHDGTSPKHIPVQKATIKEGSRLSHIYQSKEIGINSLHHQAAKEIGKDFEMVATASDGTVEAIEMKGERFVVGVQWHPEIMHEHDEQSLSLFREFCKQRRV